MADEKVTMENVELTADAINDLIKQEAKDKGIEIPPEPQRDAFGRFTAPAAKVAAKEEKEDVIYKDTFVIAGKSMTFEDSTPEGLLRQVKAANQAASAVAAPVVEEKKVDVAPAMTEEQRFELGTKIATGDPSAIEDYILKSGIIEKILAAKGLPVDQLKESLNESISDRRAASWAAATTAFLGASDWPGGDGNTKLMQYKLTELGLGEKPSVESLQKAYESLKEEGMLFAAEAVAEEKKATATTEATRATPPAPKKQMKSMTALGTGQEAGTRRSQPAVTASEEKLKKLADDPNTDPRELMRIYNEQMEAAGQLKRG